MLLIRSLSKRDFNPVDAKAAFVLAEVYPVTDPFEWVVDRMAVLSRLSAISAKGRGVVRSVCHRVCLFLTSAELKGRFGNWKRDAKAIIPMRYQARRLRTGWCVWDTEANDLAKLEHEWLARLSFDDARTLAAMLNLREGTKLPGNS